MAFLGKTVVEGWDYRQHRRLGSMHRPKCYLVVCWALVALASLAAAPPVDGPRPVDPDRPPPPLTPAEAARRFKVADGLAIGLAASEPEVTQPLSISFDD